MPAYLLAFPGGAMDLTDVPLDRVSEESHAAVREAKAAGVWVFGGGILDEVAPVRVAADGSVTPGAHPEHAGLPGGFAVLRTASRADAEAWAARFAAACRAPQGLWQFGDDPES
ncbi:transcription initiation protein [Nocardioides sp. zg-579]|uniref:Transcription initiation protein n=1 Tax=Nocardioides marmotae TaxID=2663857 RepID=A0A6I3J9R9_9ACTN|nr:YciI family protein [Nocardioides marmotae]MCR6030764.1 transcription initiation protein [Gordonia jinghuaiqii]MTB94398.1 transcription initiation protein [Nocardioides marmotae]QKE01576.1 transcription initiation protein [Nocardioides marmotae]